MEMGLATTYSSISRMRTSQRVLAPIRRPYREQTDWGRISPMTTISAVEVTRAMMPEEMSASRMESAELANVLATT